MSQLKVNSVVDASGGNTATINTYTPTESNMGGKNRIINGDMRIDQRNAGAAVTVNGAAAYTVDRWFGEDVTDGIFTVQQDSSAPTGFNFSAKITTTTADASLAAGQYAVFTQRIEGFNTADLMWGTANAKTITLSFWVRSSLTGTFGGVLANSAENYSYPFTYSISAANTWEQKSVTVTGPTAGTWIGATNGKGMIVTFALGSGSTYVGTAGAWAAADYRGGATGQTSVIGTLNATWYITGAQLEVGSVATPFERRDYGRELALCQRYFVICASAADDPLGLAALVTTTNISFAFFMTVTMRTAPTILNTISTYRLNWQSSGANSTTAPTINVDSPQVVTFDQGGYTGLTAGNAGTVRHFGTGLLGLSAEL